MDFISDEQMAHLQPGAPDFIPDEAMPNQLAPSIMTPIKEEMHPAFGTLERAVVKNFSNNPEASTRYLQEKFPYLEIKHQNGRILAKAEGEKEYRVLDPETGISPGSLEGLKELGRDVADVGFDIPAGILQGAAATAGGTAGGLATAPSGGVGALPGAMAASGAAGAGLETLRQGLGKLAGIPQDLNTRDIGMAAGVGAVAPGVTGAGITRAALSKAAPELTAAAIQSILSSSRGVAGRGADFLGKTMLPAVGEMASGVPRETSKSLSKYLPEIREMEKAGPTEAVEDVHGNIVRGLATLKQKFGKELERAINDSGKKVNVANIQEPLKRAIAQAKADAGELDNKAMNSRVADLEQIYKDLFTTSDKPARVVGLAQGEVGGVKEIPGEISAKAAFNLQEQLADQADLWKTGQGLQGRFGAGATRSEKKTSEVMRAAYDKVNDELSAATDGLSPGLKAKYRELSLIQKDLQPFFKSPERTYETLSTLAKKDRKLLFDKLSTLEKDHGIPLLEDARKLEAFRTFSNPTLMGQSGLGTTSTSRTVPLSILGGTIGSLLGYKGGGGYAGAALGGMAGAKAGAYLGSPDMLRRAITLERAAGRSMEAAKPALPGVYGGANSIWQALQKRDE